MTWKHISECLPAELSAEIAKKGADAKPAQVRSGNLTTQPGKAPASPANGRPIVTAPPTSLPRSAVAIGLVLDEVAGRADCSVYETAGQSRPEPEFYASGGASAHETAPARRQARISLRVIQGGGGRPAQQGGSGRAACARLPGGNSRSNLKLVV